MKEEDFLDFKIEEYVRCFGGASCFFRKIIDSFTFDFSIINVNNFEVEVSNKDGFFSGIKCYMLYHEKEEKCENCLIDEVVMKSSKISVEKNGKDNYLYPIFDGKGKVISVIKYDLDKKIVKEVEKVIIRDKESDEIFYKILQNSQDVVYRYDFVEDKFKYVSEAVFILLGFSLGEFVKMSYDDFLGRIHPDDSKKICRKGEGVGRERVCKEEYRWRCNNGEYRWFLDKRTLIYDKKGNLISVVGDLRDVTEDKMARLEKDILESRIARMRQKERESKQRLSLTEKEKIVLWGLCRHPLLNDEELSGKLNLKRSTLTAIKNRLKGKGWFGLRYIPNFHKLGCEFLGFFDAVLGKNVRVSDFNFVKDSSGVILRSLQDEKVFGVFASEKFVDFRKFGEDFCHRNKGVRFKDVSFFL